MGCKIWDNKTCIAYYFKEQFKNTFLGMCIQPVALQAYGKSATKKKTWLKENVLYNQNEQIYSWMKTNGFLPKYNLKKYPELISLAAPVLGMSA